MEEEPPYGSRDELVGVPAETGGEYGVAEEPDEYVAPPAPAAKPPSGRADTGLVLAAVALALLFVFGAVYYAVEYHDAKDALRKQGVRIAALEAEVGVVARNTEAATTDTSRIDALAELVANATAELVAAVNATGAGVAALEGGLAALEADVGDAVAGVAAAASVVATAKAATDALEAMVVDGGVAGNISAALDAANSIGSGNSSGTALVTGRLSPQLTLTANVATASAGSGEVWLWTMEGDTFTISGQLRFRLGGGNDGTPQFIYTDNLPPILQQRADANGVMFNNENCRGFGLPQGNEPGTVVRVRGRPGSANLRFEVQSLMLTEKICRFRAVCDAAYPAAA